ncbi:MAG: formylglycine-generating enzyme family protein [Spirochaetaceae bacterium]|nr:formylglycine-generating enzyme family protein [Spirochaetaceae bacterium]
MPSSSLRRTLSRTFVLAFCAIAILDAQEGASAFAAPGAISTREGFVRVPAGSFAMGSPESEKSRGSDEGPQHVVRLAAFSIGRYEVTQGEWVAVMGYNPSSFEGDRLPVDGVSWYEVLVYCNKRSMGEGLSPCYSIAASSDPSLWGDAPKSANGAWNAVACDFSADGYRMPTEAEWEYACRSGTMTATSFGETLDSAQANFDGNTQYLVPAKGNSLGRTAPVGSYAANAWGIYDMHGNVWEWCWDRYSDRYYIRSPPADPRGADAGRYRVLRGGSWSNFGYRLRSAARRDEDPFYRDADDGFRLVVGR